MHLGEWSLWPLFSSSSSLSHWILPGCRPRRRLLPFSVRILPRSRFPALGRHRSLLHLCRSKKTPMTTVAVAAIVTSTFTLRRGHIHVQVTKCVVWPLKHYFADTSAVVWPGPKYTVSSYISEATVHTVMKEIDTLHHCRCHHHFCRSVTGAFQGSPLCVSDIDWAKLVLILGKPFQAKGSSVVHSPYYLVHTYDMVRRSITFIYHLSSIFTSAPQ